MESRFSSHYGFLIRDKDILYGPAETFEELYEMYGPALSPDAVVESERTFASPIGLDEFTSRNIRSGKWRVIVPSDTGPYFHILADDASPEEVSQLNLDPDQYEEAYVYACPKPDEVMSVEQFHGLPEQTALPDKDGFVIQDGSYLYVADGDFESLEEFYGPALTANATVETARTYNKERMTIKQFLRQLPAGGKWRVIVPDSDNSPYFIILIDNATPVEIRREIQHLPPEDLEEADVYRVPAADERMNILDFRVAMARAG